MQRLQEVKTFELKHKLCSCIRTLGICFTNVQGREGKGGETGGKSPKEAESLVCSGFSQFSRDIGCLNKHKGSRLRGHICANAEHTFTSITVSSEFRGLNPTDTIGVSVACQRTRHKGRIHFAFCLTLTSKTWWIRNYEPSIDIIRNLINDNKVF